MFKDLVKNVRTYFCGTFETEKNSENVIIVTRVIKTSHHCGLKALIR
jgi:hypothetical protein